MGVQAIAGGQLNGGVLDFGGVLYNILAAIHINWDQGLDKMSHTVRGLGGALTVITVAVEVHTLLQRHCSLATSIAIAASLATFNYMVGELTFGIIVGTAWTGTIFAIAFAVIVAMLINAVNDMVVEIASEECTRSESWRRRPLQIETLLS